VRILAIDLAQKNSAACLLGGDSPSRYWHTRRPTKAPEYEFFVDWLEDLASSLLPPDFVVVEDVPHNQPFHAPVRAAVFRQGLIALWCKDSGLPFGLVQPAVWQAHFGLRRKRGVSSAAHKRSLVEAAYNRGWCGPPSSYEVLPAADRRKVKSDMADAYLIALWAAEADLKEYEVVPDGW